MHNYNRIINQSLEEMAWMLSQFCHIAEQCHECPFVADCPESESLRDWEAWLRKKVSR